MFTRFHNDHGGSCLGLLEGYGVSGLDMPFTEIPFNGRVPGAETGRGSCIWELGMIDEGVAEETRAPLDGRIEGGIEGGDLYGVWEVCGEE